MSSVWAVNTPDAPREALAKYRGAWSADSSTQIVLNELIASLGLAVTALDDKDAALNDLRERNAFLLTSAETAQAQLAEVERVMRIADQERVAYRSDVAGVGAEIAALKAEVERLRLPAEAWEKQEHYDSLRTAPMADVLSADEAMRVAASVARAARAARAAKGGE